MKGFVYLKLFLIALTATIFIGCEEYDEIVNVIVRDGLVPDSLNITIGSGGPTYTTSPEGQIVTFDNGDVTLTGRLYIPEGQGTFPAVVVMHGCTGLWDNFDNGEMKNSYEEWADIFHSQEKYIALFVDSYTPRSIFSDFCGQKPPQDFDCSPVFVRNTDAYAALEFLRGINKAQDDKVGLLGFSHGGTATLSTMVDYPYVEKNTIYDWRQHNGGWLTYAHGVRAPMAAPAEGGFACGISYYPGAAMFSYYGSISNPNSGKYRPYAPLLINAAELDPLYDDNPKDSTDGKTVVFVKRAELHGASVATNNQVELEVYEGANHTFDGKNSGADGQANIDAKIRTLNFLDEYLRK